MDISPTVSALLDVFEKKHASGDDRSSYHVSRTVSVLAVLYEKARNAVEFRADHLIRRAAIERILKRRLMMNGGSETIAENLITELLWARYIDTSLVNDAKIKRINHIVERYLVVRHHVPTIHQKSFTVSWDALLGLASSEIDEVIVPPEKREALIQFFYQAMRPLIDLPNREESTVNLYTYVAAERSYAQADDALISYHLLKTIQPDWLTLSHERVSEKLPEFWKTIELIQQALHDPLTDALYRYLRRHIAPFLLIRDFMLEEGHEARAIIDDETKLTEKLSTLSSHKYQEIGQKVRRAMVRSFIYIFLTKMLFALALEAPYDMYIAKKISILPLVVNTMFPPFMLFLVAGLVRVPGEDNTKRLTEQVKKIFYHFDDMHTLYEPFAVKQTSRRPVLAGVFSLFYIATFGISFGVINILLSLMHFSIASKLIFVFFVALVSFFAFRIRQSAKEYEVMDRQDFLEPLTDIFFLPILRAGQILSSQIAKINIFMFLFDFILEAPLKVIFEVVEEWIRFVRTKKDEIV